MLSCHRSNRRRAVAPAAVRNRAWRWSLVLGFAVVRAVMAQSTESEAQSTPPLSSETTAPSVQVTAPRFITPLPGLIFDREQTTVNVQSATAGDIRATQAQTVTDLMNRTMQSVNVNDYQGNPFQQELTY